MINEVAIYDSAQFLIKHHGEDAAIHAAMEADACLEQGDFDGKAVWMRVIKVIEELSEPAASSSLGASGSRMLH